MRNKGLNPPPGKDPSVAALAVSHLVLIAIAVASKWRFLDVVWIYWYEGLIAGLFACIRLLHLPEVGASAGMSFAISFVVLHMFYCAFFAIAGNPPRFDRGVAICTFALLISHALAFRHSARRDITQPPDIEHFCGFAGLRILPVMAAIAFGLFIDARGGSSSTGQLVVFLALAGIADIAMQIKERSLKRADVELEQTTKRGRR